MDIHEYTLWEVGYSGSLQDIANILEYPQEQVLFSGIAILQLKDYHHHQPRDFLIEGQELFYHPQISNSQLMFQINRRYYKENRDKNNIMTEAANR